MNLNDEWFRMLVETSPVGKFYSNQLTRSQSAISECLNSLQEPLTSISRKLNEFQPVLPEQSDEDESSFLSSELIPTFPEQFLSESSSRVHFNDQLDRICQYRVNLYEFIKAKNFSRDQLASLIDEMEELEARALTVLVLPSVHLSDNSEELRYIQHVLDKIEEQATVCLNKANKFSTAKPDDSSRKTSSVDPMSTEKPKLLVGLSLASPFVTIAKAKQFVENNMNLLYPLLSDYKLREQTVNVKRIISCTCSQITGHDKAHCLDRMNYVLAFLANKPIRPAGSVGRSFGSEKVTLGELLPIELGSVYAWQCLFASTLSQAEHQFAHHVESAVTFASLLAGILAKHPERVPEFMARIFIACPILCHVDKSAPKLAEEMMGSMDMLIRWRGIARLTGAIAIYRPPLPSSNSSPVPYLNPAFLWQLLASIANQKFVVGGTCEIIHGLLEVSLTTLLKLYGKQFIKLLSTIVHIIQSSTDLRQSTPEIALLSTIELVLKYKL